jgi:hypothetical protein
LENSPPTFVSQSDLLEAIDHDQLGRWLNRIPRGKEVEVCTGGYLYDRVRRASGLLCRVEGITSAADLRQYLKGEQAKLAAKRGRRTPWEQKLAALTWYKVNSFFVGAAPD